MKKLTILLSVILVLTGCSNVTKSNNAGKSNDTSVNNISLSKAKSSKDDIKFNMNLLDTEGEEMSLEDIIVKMRKILEIESDYDEIKTQEYEDFGSKNTKTHYINFMNTKNSNSASLSTDRFGNLQNYSRYEENNKIEVNYSKDEARSKVQKILYDLYGEPSKEFIIEDDSTSNNISSPCYYFIVRRVVNGIKVPSDCIYAEIGKSDLKPYSIYLDTSTNYDFASTKYFEKLTKEHTNDEIFDAFIKTNPLVKSHLSVLDLSSKTSSLYSNAEYKSVYATLDRQIFINAENLVPNYYVAGSFGYANAEMAKDEAPADSGLTNVEEEHIKDLKTQSTIEKAEKAARTLLNISEDYSLNWSGFRNYANKKDIYQWDMNFVDESSNSISVSLKGDDLTLLSYYKYSEEDDKNERNYKIDDAIEIANGFLVDKGSMKLDDLRMSELSKYQQDNTNYYNIEYVRKVNKDEYVLNDTINISVSKSTGKVVSYDKSWDFQFDKKNFDADLSLDDIYKVLKEDCGFELVYKRDYIEGEKKIYPYYQLKNSDTNNIIIDGDSGKLLDQWGETLNSQNNINYPDLDEAENPEIIEDLASYNIGYINQDLKPKEKVKQIDLFRVFLSSENYWRDNMSDLSDDEIYERLEAHKLLGDKEKREPEKIVTQEDYARYAIRYLKLDEVAKKNNIYKDMYDDVNSQNKNYGYLVLAKEFGLIKSENKKLTPERELTREEALYYFYDLINR